MNYQRDDKRLIEDYLPIEEISKEASREKSVRKGHISTLHLWWARRPLVACRAAVYGALVPVDRWVKEVNLKNPPTDAAKAEKMANGAKKGLNRKAAGDFVAALCKYPGDPRIIEQARRHIWEAHADRLTVELTEAFKLPRPAGKGWGEGAPSWLNEFKWPADRATVTADDIAEGRAPKPRVLDPFAGGGAIPLEALRLGCESYALDLNPVAHIIELCTLVYPQKYGKPDLTARGMTGPKNAKDETTWGGLVDEVRYWGNWILEKVRAEIGDLYPTVPDPEAKPEEIGGDPQGRLDFAKDVQGRLAVPRGHLTPIAYLWTRTVSCKNPTCGASVPLIRQTWLCKKESRSVALRPVLETKNRRLSFEVIDVEDEASLDFDPSAFSKGGNAACPFCGTVAELEYVKEQGRAGKLGDQIVGVVAIHQGSRGWVYLSGDSLDEAVPNASMISARLEQVTKSSGLSPPDESIAATNTYDNTLGITVRPYGLTSFAHLFSPRQQVFHLSVASAIRGMRSRLDDMGISEAYARSVMTILACVADRAADFGCKLCVWNPYKDSGTTHAFGRQTITMVWDYSEVNHFNTGNAGWSLGLDRIIAALESAPEGTPSDVRRGTATRLPHEDALLDVIITDPPYYDNVPYADISDFFYVWLKRSVGPLYSEHFAATNTPKKLEAIADAGRHAGDRDAARLAYERMMAESFSEACRALKPGGLLAVVYAHKTTLGWSTLVDALRTAGFTVTEAWPLDTEFAGRLRGYESAALASSIFLVARKRPHTAGVGNYEDDVQPELEQIVRERVETLWDMGIAGADLVIAALGAGLRAFTKYARVEFANGEAVPAERFLTEVEGVVLDTILRRLSKEVGGNGGKMTLAGVDEPTRFYILWRYAYKAAPLDAGEAIIFANGTHVELDGQKGLAAGSRALVEKAKSKYRLRDFTERGPDDKLGQPEGDGHPAPLIDALHRVLWLIENRPRELPKFLEETRPDRERLRLVAQALAGTQLKGSAAALGEDAAAKSASAGTTPAEAAALGKLTANWRSLIEQPMAASDEAERLGLKPKG